MTTPAIPDLAAVIYGCIYDHGNGKYLGEKSAAQRREAISALDKLQVLAALSSQPSPEQAVPMTEWRSLDAARLNSEEFDGPYWLAMKNGEVAVGEYEWRQGWNPHGFNLIDGRRVGASEVTHTANFVRQSHPSIGITAQGAQEGV